VEISTSSTSKAAPVSKTKEAITTQQKERNAAVTLGILIGIYIICWTPYTVSTFLRAFGVDTPMAFPVISAVMGWINSAVNPIVYAVRNKKFQDAFRRMLSPCKN